MKAHSNKIACLLCGKAYRRVCRHAQQAHGVTAKEYKHTFGLDTKRGLLTDEAREIMREHTKQNGTIENLKKGVHTRYKKGVSNNYPRSKQTLERLKTHFQRVANKNGTPYRVQKITIQCALCGTPKEIYPRYYKENKNYCGITCRNRAINNKKY